MPLNPDTNILEACRGIDPDGEVETDGTTISLWVSDIHPDVPTDDELNAAYIARLEAGDFAEWDEASRAIATSPLTGAVTRQAGESSLAVITLAELSFLFTNETVRDVPAIIRAWEDMKAQLLQGIALGAFVLDTETITAWNQLIADFKLPTRMLFTV